MSRKVRTARGMTIDMAALAAKNEKVKAVGNVPMNARGDRLNTDGSVKMKAEDVAVAHHNASVPPQQQPLSDTKPIIKETAPPPPPPPPPPVVEEPVVPDLEEQFSQDPEPISKITRTRDDGTKYVEIEYDDGSIETVELEE